MKRLHTNKLTYSLMDRQTDRLSSSKRREGAFKNPFIRSNGAMTRMKTTCQARHYPGFLFQFIHRLNFN